MEKQDFMRPYEVSKYQTDKLHRCETMKAKIMIIAFKKKIQFSIGNWADSRNDSKQFTSLEAVHKMSIFLFQILWDDEAPDKLTR